jgi:hypothetical protein
LVEILLEMVVVMEVLVVMEVYTAAVVVAPEDILEMAAMLTLCPTLAPINLVTMVLVAVAVVAVLVDLMIQPEPAEVSVFTVKEVVVQVGGAAKEMLPVVAAGLVDKMLQTTQHRFLVLIHP